MVLARARHREYKRTMPVRCATTWTSEGLEARERLCSIARRALRHTGCGGSATSGRLSEAAMLVSQRMSSVPQAR